jgi:ubiquinone/menaquinone biosynthesis C-methylase UbiE
MFDIASESEKIIAEYGPWTAHNISIAPGISTMGETFTQQWRVDFLDRLMRTYLDNRSSETFFKNLRILDLACLEGLFAIEFARAGAETVGLEIRDAHLAKAKFAKDAIGLEKCTFVQGDVRAIPSELGNFDVVICAGILYHLDFPDCVRFLRAIAERSTGLVIVDSHFAYDDIETSVLPLSEMRAYQFEGQIFHGREIVEHSEHVSSEEKAKAHLWASIDNNVSVWLDERDVVKIFDKQGFDLAFRDWAGPNHKEHAPDRPTLVFKRR